MPGFENLPGNALVVGEPQFKQFVDSTINRVNEINRVKAECVARRMALLNNLLGRFGAEKVFRLVSRNPKEDASLTFSVPDGIKIAESKYSYSFKTPLVVHGGHIVVEKSTGLFATEKQKQPVLSAELEGSLEIKESESVNQNRICYVQIKFHSESGGGYAPFEFDGGLIREREPMAFALTQLPKNLESEATQVKNDVPSNSGKFASSYTLVMNREDAERLDIVRSNVYSTQEVAADRVVLVSEIPAKEGNWKGTITFNPTTLRGSYRTEYKGQITTGTSSLKSAPGGRFDYTFTREGESVSNRAQLIPNEDTNETERTADGHAEPNSTGANSKNDKLSQSPELIAFSETLGSVWSGNPLAQESLTDLSPWELKLLRNAIFARHGRAFDSGKLSGFFHSYPGYKEDESYGDSRITPTDRANAEAIKVAESSARRPVADTDWNALRSFLDALAAGDVDAVAALIHSTKPVERVVLTLEEPRKESHRERLFGKSKRLEDLCLDDGANGEGYSFMMSALWDFTMSAKHAGNGMFFNKGNTMEIGFTEISGKWWLTKITDAAP